MAGDPLTAIPGSTIKVPRSWAESAREYHNEYRNEPVGKKKNGGVMRNNDGSEDDLALELAERHADELRYVANWGKWYSFNGTVWRADTTLHMFDLARAICRELVGAYPARKTAKTVAAVEKPAGSDRRLAATTDQWDANPWLITAANATVDLRTGESSPPDPLDYITKKTSCAVAPPGTPHPIWTAFLDRVTGGDRDLQAFYQRYVGYCLTGVTTEHAFVYCYGTGANGKSTFINTIATVFGDYATVADMSTFLAKRNEAHPTDLAHLVGARLVTAQETQRGRSWDEVKIKALTGGDKLTARFIRQDFFDFTPVFKLLIGGNHKPKVSTVDIAIRRRLLIGPFTVTIPKEERDTELLQKLQAEHPAILRWAINGCLQWQQIGLAPPDRVISATESYFAEQNIVQQWLDECTESVGADHVTTLIDLFDSWKRWNESHGNFKCGTSQALSQSLQDRDFQKDEDGHTHRVVFRGLAVRK